MSIINSNLILYRNILSLNIIIFQNQTFILNLLKVLFTKNTKNLRKTIKILSKNSYSNYINLI